VAVSEPGRDIVADLNWDEGRRGFTGWVRLGANDRAEFLVDVDPPPGESLPSSCQDVVDRREEVLSIAISHLREFIGRDGWHPDGLTLAVRPDGSVKVEVLLSLAEDDYGLWSVELALDHQRFYATRFDRTQQ
jgi:hypothetical protein